MPGALIATAAVVASLVSIVPSAPDVRSITGDQSGAAATGWFAGANDGVGAPGDALGLSPSVPDTSRSGPARIPLAPASGAGIGGAVIASAVLARRRNTAAAGNQEDPLYVYVPGWQMQRINTADFHGENVGYPGGGPGLVKATIEYNLQVFPPPAEAEG